MQYSVSFPGGAVRYLHNTPFAGIDEVLTPANTIVMTDANVENLHSGLFNNFKAIITIPAGEEHKNHNTILSLVQQLMEHKAHRKTFLLGVGGGMVTDITGFVAAIYMRGLRFGFAPTTLLGMVDASIGGKNGINIGLQKNMIGTIQQPEFILFDNQLLTTLPDEEWSNGFAEVIKSACLFDADLFGELSANNIVYYQQNDSALSAMIAKSVEWKNKIVLADERENGLRKLLNFGHTSGHAFETVCNIPHGQAVGLGILVACKISEQFGLAGTVTQQLHTLLQQYNLPVSIQANTNAIMDVLMMDKKRDNYGVDFIILKSIGNAEIKNIEFDTVKNAIEEFTHAGNH